jgi:hypothetical protein
MLCGKRRIKRLAACSHGCRPILVSQGLLLRVGWVGARGALSSDRWIDAREFPLRCKGHQMPTNGVLVSPLLGRLRQGILPSFP